MRVVYNVILTMLHTIGLLFFAIMYASRFALLLSWTHEEEMIFELCGILVFGIHYALLWIGHKKHLICFGVIKWLQIWEMILFIPQFTLIAYMCISSLNIENLPVLFSFGATCSAILLLRKFSSIYIQRKTEDGFA